MKLGSPVIRSISDAALCVTGADFGATMAAAASVAAVARATAFRGEAGFFCAREVEVGIRDQIDDRIGGADILVRQFDKRTIFR
jgi:hypothetical protein